MKKDRINHQKQEARRDAQVREALNATNLPGKSSNSSSKMFGKSSNSSSNLSGKNSNLANSLYASTNPYSAKSTDSSLKKSSSKAESSQKGDKTKTKPETPTRVPTKRVREDSKSPAPVRSSSSEGALPKKGDGRSVLSPSKLPKHGHHASEKGSSSTRKPADRVQLQPSYAAPPPPNRDCPLPPHPLRVGGGGAGG